MHPWDLPVFTSPALRLQVPLFPAVAAAAVAVSSSTGRNRALLAESF